MTNKLVVSVAGLHCKACEILTEDRLKEIENIEEVSVSHKTGLAEIIYKGEKPNMRDIATGLKDAGYALGKTRGEVVSSDDVHKKETPSGRGFSYWFSIFAAIIIIYWLLNKVHVIDFGNVAQDGFSFSMAILIGLVAGVSTCLAIVGGLILSVSANYAKSNPEASRAQKFKPQIFFNLGRILGFFVLGGILGLAGSAFKISVLTNSIITLIIGFVIFILGLKLLEISPAINRFDFSLPKKFGRIAKINNPLLLGALTFFLPCGFTQAMQVYALGTGSFWQGGLIMALFALGTAPGLLGIGGLSALAGKKKSKIFFLLAGIVVVAFGLFNLANGYRLFQVSTGGAYDLSNLIGSNQATDPTNDFDMEVIDGVRIIRMREHNRGYTPNTFTVLKDQPVRWVINAEAPNSCASALVVPSLKIQAQLRAGENIFEFTPDKVGEIRFSCSMGMYSGKFIVVENKKDLR